MARSHIKSGQGAPHYTDRQKWLEKNFRFLNTHIVHHHSSKSASKPTHEATVSRPPDAGSSEELEQPSSQGAQYIGVDFSWPRTWIN